MAQPIIRKKCTVTAKSATIARLTPNLTAAGAGRSPAVPITFMDVTTTGAPTDFWDGSGRYEVIVRRL
jgi:hypothetical protein